MISLAVILPRMSQTAGAGPSHIPIPSDTLDVPMHGMGVTVEGIAFQSKSAV